MKYELDSGIEIQLAELRQVLEYEGLLEGLPTRQRNDRVIRSLVEKESNSKAATLLIEPSQQPIAWDQPTPYPFGEPAGLPAVRCIGRFKSMVEFSPQTDYSMLTVLWWQDEFAMPIDESVVAVILAMDWREHAARLQY